MHVALMQLYVLLGDGLIYFRIFFKKILKLCEFRIDLSRLFHSIITDGKKRVFEETLFKMKKG